MSHLLSCSAHLKSTADVKPDAWQWMHLKPRLTLISDACENGGPSTALGIFHPCGTHRRGSAQLVSAETGVWEAASLDSSLAVSSEGFSRWSSLPEAASPLPSLTNYLKVTRAHLSSWWSNAADLTSRWLPLSLYCLLWLTIYELGHIPKAVLKVLFSRVFKYYSQNSVSHLHLHIEHKHIEAFSFHLWVICRFLSFYFQAGLTHQEATVPFCSSPSFRDS